MAVPRSRNGSRMGNWEEKYGPTPQGGRLVVGQPPTEEEPPPAPINLPVQGGDLRNLGAQRKAAAAAAAQAGQAPAPAAQQTAGAQAQPDLAQYGSYDNYHAGVMRRTQGGQLDPGANPLEGYKPNVIAAGGNPSQDLIQDPFNPTGPPITRAQFETLQGQMGMTHTASPRAQAKMYGEKMVAGLSGATGHAPMTSKSLLFGNASAPDDFMVSNPEYASPEVRAKYKEDGVQIRDRFSKFMSRNRGELSLDDLMKFQDTLNTQFGTHPRFINNIIQDYIKNGPAPLRAEYERRKLGEGQLSGNAMWNEQPPEDRRFMEAAINAARAANGFVLPKAAEFLGFAPAKGPTGEATWDHVTPEMFLDRINTFYDLNLDSPSQAPTATGSIQLADGTMISSAPRGPFARITDASGTEIGQTWQIPEAPNVREMRRTGQGLEMVFGDGNVLEESEAQEAVDELMAQENPQARRMAAIIHKAFGLELAGPADPIGTATRKAKMDKIERLQREIEAYEREQRNRELTAMTPIIPT